MARPPRCFVPDYPVHIVHRGNNRQDIFRGTRDYHIFRRYLREATIEHEVAVNAYVLMTNHVHLLMTPTSVDGISRTLHSLSRRYSGYFNKAYGRTGTLWEGRFHASVIHKDRYLLACHRYIDLNPVRARLASTPDQYSWSSHRVHAAGARDPVVTPHPCVLTLGGDSRSRQAAYRSLFKDGDDSDFDAIRRACRGGRSIGR